jgi:hypothetical protein
MKKEELMSGLTSSYLKIFKRIIFSNLINLL